MEELREMDLDKMLRTFIAIDVDEAVKQKLVAVQEELAAAGAQLKLVEPENIHITMRFLGDVPEDKVGPITDALFKAVSGTSQFDIGVHGVGAFPTIHYIRVVWAGVRAGREELILLKRGIDQELRPLGFAPERDFVPHLTLARVKAVRQKERLAALVKKMVDVEFGTTRAQAVELKQSTLTPKGPIYSTLARVGLS